MASAVSELEVSVSSSSIAVTVVPVAPLKDARVDKPETARAPVIFVADSNSIVPVPLGIIFIASLDLKPSMLLSLILMPGKSMVPVPLGMKTMALLVPVEMMLLAVNSNVVAASVPAYTSLKLSLIFCIATRRSSPVPSFATTPMLIVCCVII